MDISTYLLKSIVIILAAVNYTVSLSFKYKYLEIEKKIEVEISGAATTAEGDAKYIAVAFAKEPRMQDADGYFCTDQELKSFTIEELHQSPTEHENSDPAEKKNISISNGQLTCKFWRPIAVTKTISGGESFSFDLSKREFSVLLASGTLSGGMMDYHGRTDRKILPQKTSVVLPNAITNDTCNNGKNCLQMPTGCSLQDPDCIFFSLRQENEKFVVELSGGTGNGKQYVAVAFGVEAKMNNADLYYCDGERLRSGVIREFAQRPVDLVDKFVKVDMAGTVNGVGKCKFSRDICVSKVVSDGFEQVFDFANQSYYILYAHGDMTQGGLMVNHGENARGHTATAIDFAIGGDITYQCVAISDPRPPPDTTTPVLTTTSNAISYVSNISMRSMLTAIGSAVIGIMVVLF